MADEPAKAGGARDPSVSTAPTKEEIRLRRRSPYMFSPVSSRPAEVACLFSELFLFFKVQFDSPTKKSLILLYLSPSQTHNDKTKKNNKHHT